MGIDIFALFVAVPVAILTALFVYFIRASSTQNEAPSQVETKRPLWKRPRLVGYWASAVVLSVVFILAGLPKIGEFNDVLTRFSEWGYSRDFLLFIGASELVAGIFLLIPQTALYAALYLSAVMVGAIYTHLAFDTVVWALLPAFCLSFLLFIAYEAYERRAESKSESESESRLSTGSGARQRA